jgi:hypothetical protein
MLWRFLLRTGEADVPVCCPHLWQHLVSWPLTTFSAGFYNCGWFGGSIPAAALTFGCNYIQNDFAWRIPLIMQAFACIIVMIFVFFIPESPRYLMANGREAEAIAFLAKYHGNGNPQSRLVLLEVEEMREGIRQDGIDKSNFDCKYRHASPPADHLLNGDDRSSFPLHAQRKVANGSSLDDFDFRPVLRKRLGILQHHHLRTPWGQEQRTAIGI